MKRHRNRRVGDHRLGLNGRLARYLATAGAVGVGMASEAQAVVVTNTTVQPFGINGAIPIDFNSDGQIDYEIDHDRLDLGGGNIVDFLQLDKNDTNGLSPGENPCPINVFDTFPLNGTSANNSNPFDVGYVTSTSAKSDYPASLGAGTLIGPASFFNFEEADNFNGSGKTIRANRLIDEDAGQCDQAICGLAAAQVQAPTNGPNFLGLDGEVGYLGVRMNLNSSGVRYGWIGIRITNEADATGEVVGWGYETSGAAISAGSITGDYNGNGNVDAADYVVWRNNLGLMGGATTAQGDGNNDGNVTTADYSYWQARFGNTSGSGTSLSAVPEPSSILLGMMIGLLLCSRHVWKRIIGH